MKAVGTILKLAGQNYVDQLPEHLRDSAIETLNKVHAAADTFNAEKSANAANANLSERGRVDGMKAAAMSAFARLSPVETTIKNLTDRAASIEKSLLSKATYTPPTDTAERRLMPRAGCGSIDSSFCSPRIIIRPSRISGRRDVSALSAGSGRFSISSARF